jgi:hypothetical protein
MLIDALTNVSTMCVVTVVPMAMEAFQRMLIISFSNLLAIHLMTFFKKLKDFFKNHSKVPFELTNQILYFIY